MGEKDATQAELTDAEKRVIAWRAGTRRSTYRRLSDLGIVRGPQRIVGH